MNAVDVRGVTRAHALGDQQLDRLAEQLVARVAEHAFGLAVDEHDLAVLVAHDHAVGRGLDKLAKWKVGVLDHAGRNHVEHGAWMRVVDPDPPAVSLDRELAERKPQAAVRARRGTAATDEPFEHVFALLGGHAGARVGHRELDAVRRRARP